MNEAQLKKQLQSAFNLTEIVTTRWSSRLAGSEACLECAHYLHQELSGFCDRVKSEEFSIHPGSFLGYIRINIVLYAVAVVALAFQQIYVAFATANISVLITVLQFFYYREFIDFLFLRKMGKNVYGIIEPSHETKQQVIISAHHDSAHVFNLLEKDPASYNKKVLRGTMTQLGLLVIIWVLFIADFFVDFNPAHYLLAAGILTLASYNLNHLWYFYDKQRGTPGAGGNMICVAIAIEIGRYFSQLKRLGRGLKHTQLIIGSWDAEECGLRGARSFVKKHQTELIKTKSYNLNLECMYDHKELHFLDSDLNNFVRLSTEMARECTTISENLGYPTKILSFPFLAGGTDAAEFAKRGIAATTLVGMSWQKRDHTSVYHTTRDTVDAVDEEAVKRSIEIGIEYVMSKDAQV